MPPTFPPLVQLIALSTLNTYTKHANASATDFSSKSGVPHSTDYSVDAMMAWEQVGDRTLTQPEANPIACNRSEFNLCNSSTSILSQPIVTYPPPLLITILSTVTYHHCLFPPSDRKNEPKTTETSSFIAYEKLQQSATAAGRNNQPPLVRGECRPQL